MFRLAEYFVVFGYDFEKSKHNQSDGKIIQKFPKKDWPDYKYQMQVELFCQPCGWEISNVKHPPKYLVAYLTDPEANQYYLACLSFHEAISSSFIDQANVGPSSVSKQMSNNSRNLSNTSCTNNCDSNSNNGSDIDSFVGVEDPNLIKPTDRYAPKSLILLSRHGCLDVLKNCLSVIYSIYMDPHREISLEYVIGNILSAVDVPTFGGSRISFTIGAGDRQIIQTPVSASIPVTRMCVSMLFKHLGMQNVLVVFSSLINDQKILLYSRSFNRLTDACHSLRSLLYPLKYGNVFIPILPKKLIEILTTPTPFLAGVHSIYKPIYDLTDVVMVDLDGGSVKCPDTVPLVPLSEPYHSWTINSLTKILNPDLLTADQVYPPAPAPPHDPAWQDKLLRAVFIRLFCRLFAGYRSCLTLTRIRPRPVIHFNQSLFLLLRGLRNETDEFVCKLLSCMSFGQFIQERGVPYRVCDVFDDEYESMTRLLSAEIDSVDDMAVVEKLARKLYDNECRGTPIVHSLPQEAKLAHTRLHAQTCRLLDENLIADHIKTNLRNKKISKNSENHEPRVVPHGLDLDKHIFKTEALSDKNKVIREFVANIFNNHITEALKRLNTIRQDLKNRLIRRIFIDELYRQLYPDQSNISQLNMASEPNADISSERKALLGYQQFDLVNDLMGESLRHENQNEDSGVVPIIMELSTKFCTQLSNVRYYSNMTCQIQQHPIWESQKFWLTVFCDQVNNEIRQLYLHHSKSQYRQRQERLEQAKRLSADLSTSPFGKKSQSKNVWRNFSRNSGVSSQPSLTAGRTKLSSMSGDDETQLSGELTRLLYTNKMSTLDMAAEEMKIISVADGEVQSQEESTIYAQILHFINLIVNFRIPINIVDKNEQRAHTARIQRQQSHSHSGDGDGDGISMATSASDESDIESGYEDGGDTNSRITSLETWLKKFVDKTGSDNNLSQSVIDNIKGKIEGIIEGHMSNLETIYPEVQNIPKVKKVEVTSPVLLPGERVILINNKESVRCYLLLDGRHEKIDLQRQREHDFDDIGGQLSYQYGSHHQTKIVDDDDDFYALSPLLPAQGALFVTNYRVVFHGSPKDPYQSNKLICRSFPVASLRSVKKLGVKTFAITSSTVPQNRNLNVIAGRTIKSRASEGTLDVIRICSNTFQMLKVGLELEDSSAEIKDELSIKLMFLRYPSMLNLSFNVSEKIARNHQKFSYNTGLPDDGSFRHPPSESVVSSLYSSMQNFSLPPTVPSVQNSFSRNTALSKEVNFHKYVTMKGRISPASNNKRLYISESESEMSSVIHEDEIKDYNFLITDQKLLDKLRHTAGYQEYVRLNMVNFSGTGDHPSSSSDKVRLIPNFNDRYQNVKSYQSMMVVPHVFNDSSLKKLAKTHRKNRFPIITWKSNKTNSYLLRGAAFQTPGIMSKLSNTNSTAGTQIIRHAASTLQRGFQTMTLKTIYDDRVPESEITAAKEQIRYFQSLVNISPSYEEIQLHLCTVEPLVQWSENANNRYAHFKRNPREKVFKNIVSTNSKTKTKIRNEIVKRSISAEILNTTTGGMVINNKFKIHEEEEDISIKYADEDNDEDILDIQTQPNYCTTSQAFPSHKKDFITRNNHSQSFRRPNPSSNTPFRRNASFVAGMNSRIRWFNLLSSSGLSVSKNSNSEDEIFEDDTNSSNCNAHNQLSEVRIVPLYILGEKSQTKTIGKSENFQDIEFVPVDFNTKHQIKEAYESMVKAILTDNVTTVPIINPLNPATATKYQLPSPETNLVLACNKWLLQVQNLMDLAGTVVDLIDIQAASVVVCLEDGWDATSQIVSLAQVMLDRHYRTIEGFWALIEKDWLMAGHKFESRLSMTSHPKAGNLIPVFLQFLDAVHQLLRQFPMSFEFNDFLLKFLAYHHMSNRFHNFKMDCEADRVAWWRVLGDDSSLGSTLHEGNSIRNYILYHHDQWPVFFNFLYNPILSQEVLRPCTNLSMIHIWEYFLGDDLSSGSVYDLDHFCPSYRKRNTQQYDPILNGAFNNSHVVGVYAVLGLREGCEVKNWQKIWRESNDERSSDFRKLESLLYDVYDGGNGGTNSIVIKQPCSPLRRSRGVLSSELLVAHFRHNKENIERIREVCYLEHKSVSLHRIEKRHQDNSIDPGSGPEPKDNNSYLTNKTHNLQRLPVQSEFQTLCHICRNHASVIGTVMMIQCSTCHLVCHDKCLKECQRPCIKDSPPPPPAPPAPLQPKNAMFKSPSMEVVSSSKATSDPISRDYTDTQLTQPESNYPTQNSLTTRSNTIPRDVTQGLEIPKRKSEDLGSQLSEVIFSGDLWKLSEHKLFPKWQKKYFILDIIRHELRYCDSKDSRSNIKRIHIQDITGVRILKTLQNHQKRFPESGFLEIQTEERTYKLASESQSSINEWMERIQNSIQ